MSASIRRSAFGLAWLFAALVLTPGLVIASDEDDDPASDEDGEHRKRKKNYRGDANSPWFHVGGGVGLVQSADVFSEVGSVLAGRFVLGGGGYTYGFYGGGGVEISGHAYVPFAVHGLGMIGVHIPVPVVHPMFGLKIGGGVSFRGLEPEPEVTIGANLGVIIRQFDGIVGVRIMVEPAAVVSVVSDSASAEVFFTFALVL